jgi:hypothetical protein
MDIPIEVLPQGDIQVQLNKSRVASDVNAAQGYSGLCMYFNVYPNPNPGDKIFIELKGLDSNQEANIELYDELGKLIQSEKEFAFEDGSLNTEVKIKQHLSPGIYLVKIQSGKCFLIRKIVIE